MSYQDSYSARENASAGQFNLGVNGRDQDLCHDYCIRAIVRVHNNVLSDSPVILNKHISTKLHCTIPLSQTEFSSLLKNTTKQ